MKKLSRVLTLVLALAICFSCMAVSVFAADGDGDGNGNNTTTTTYECTCVEGGCEGCTECIKTANCTKETCKHQDCACKDEDKDGEEDGGDDEVPVTTNPADYTPCGTSESAPKARPFVADISGKYRTSMTKIMKTVSAVSVATSLENNELVIDPVTNTVGNLYDSLGNLIPCTLSSDGHFIIIPTNEGYAFIPTGR